MPCVQPLKKKRQNAGGSDLVRYEELMLEKTESRATRATSFFFLFWSFVLLGPHPWHVEVPRLGV